MILTPLINVSWCPLHRNCHLKIWKQMKLRSPSSSPRPSLLSPLSLWGYLSRTEPSPVKCSQDLTHLTRITFHNLAPDTRLHCFWMNLSKGGCLAAKLSSVWCILIIKKLILIELNEFWNNWEVEQKKKKDYFSLYSTFSVVLFSLP